MRDDDGCKRRGGAGWRLLVAAVWVLASLGLQAQPDLAREQRLAEQTMDAILDGEPMQLEQPDGPPFFAIYTESFDGPARGAVLLLHGRGMHPDWAQVIRPLRIRLAEDGWNTLSIQVPVLEKEAKYFDYLPTFPYAIPRIEAALDFLREAGNERVTLLAHSCGVHMANHWMLAQGAAVNARIDAYVGIGMGATDWGQPMQEPYALPQLTVPVLDLYGEMDYGGVLRNAAERWALIEAAGNPLSEQFAITGASHYYPEPEEVDRLYATLLGWLERIP